MGNDTAYRIDGDQVYATLDLRNYRLEAVKKAAYRLAAVCTVVLGRLNEHQLAITVQLKSGSSEQAAKAIMRRFFDELLDQELREYVAGETAALRALILAQAFSRTDLVSSE